MIETRSRRVRARLAAIAAVLCSATIAAMTSCTFEKGTVAGPEVPCAVLGTSCAGRALLTCSALGELPTEQTCTWGCTETGTPHCGQLVPSGGAVVPADLDAAATLADTVIGSNSNVYTGGGSGGQITNSVRASNNTATTYEEIDGIGFVVRGNVGVFRFKSLTVNANLDFRGSNAVALVATGDITINGVLDLQGSGSAGCGSGSDVQAPGPGGFAGGNAESAGSGPGAGAAGSSASSNESGGGGAGHGAAGGSGARPAGHAQYPAAGQPAGDERITVLVGGAGGGGGGSGGNNGGEGGGGGGAVQLVAGGTVRIIGALHGINAGGCGGEGESDSGGGGGAGGTILIEAPVIVIDAAGLAVNGGGGGGGSGDDGEHGALAAMGASGGAGTGTGGSGGAAGGVSGSIGTGTSSGGGGGGAVGRVRLNTWDGTVTILNGAFISPALTDTPTSATVGKPDLQ